MGIIAANYEVVEGKWANNAMYKFRTSIDREFGYRNAHTCVSTITLNKVKHHEVIAMLDNIKIYLKDTLE